MVPISIDPLDRTLKIEAEEEEARLKMALVPAVPWMSNPIVDEVAFIPITVPLSINLPTPMAEEDVQIVLKPIVPPDRAFCLPLKVDQSVAESCPVLEAEAVGRFIVSPVVVVAMLNIVPDVPVAKAEGLKTVAMEVAPEPVIAPVKVMVWLPVKKAAPLQATLPPAVVTRPLLQVPKAEIFTLVVEAMPAGVIWKRVVPEEEATTKAALFPDMPFTSKATPEVVAFTPTTVPSFSKEAAEAKAVEPVK